MDATKEPASRATAKHQSPGGRKSSVLFALSRCRPVWTSYSGTAQAEQRNAAAVKRPGDRL